jgi:hypothetical protein
MLIKLESKMQKHRPFHHWFYHPKKGNDKGTPLQKVMIPVLDDNQRVEMKLFLT